MCWSRLGHFGAKGATDARIKSCLLKLIELNLKKMAHSIPSTPTSTHHPEICQYPMFMQKRLHELKNVCKCPTLGKRQAEAQGKFTRKRLKIANSPSAQKILNSIITSLVQISYNVVPIGQTPRSKILPRRGNVFLFQKCNFYA